MASADTEIVDEDVEIRELIDCSGDAGGAAQVSRERVKLGLREPRTNLADRFIHARLSATVDDDGGAFPGEGFGDGESDARSRAGDQRAFAIELQVHAFMVGEGEDRTCLSTATENSAIVGCRPGLRKSGRSGNEQVGHVPMLEPVFTTLLERLSPIIMLSRTAGRYEIVAYATSRRIQQLLRSVNRFSRRKSGMMTLVG